MNDLALKNQESTQLAPAGLSGSLSIFSSIQAFEDAQRMAKALAASTLVPKEYQNNIGNCIIAMEIAARCNVPVLAVTQNLNVIHGRPSWSSQYIIAALNSSGRFSPLRFVIEQGAAKKVSYTYWEGERGNKQKKTGVVELDRDATCHAWAYDKATGDKLEGPPVSLTIAVQEGWYTKDGSKWVTMSELMLRYRAAAFFGRLYAPDILAGMQTVEEIQDVGPKDITAETEVIAANDNRKPARRAQAQPAASAADSVIDDLNAGIQPATAEGGNSIEPDSMSTGNDGNLF